MAGAELPVLAESFFIGDALRHRTRVRRDFGPYFIFHVPSVGLHARLRQKSLSRTPGGGYVSEQVSPDLGNALWEEGFAFEDLSATF